MASISDSHFMSISPYLLVLGSRHIVNQVNGTKQFVFECIKYEYYDIH